MQIPSYQIQNVLKLYSRQLSQGKIIARDKTFGRSQVSPDNVNLSAEGRRTAIIEKVTTSIVDRITTEGPQQEQEYKIAAQVEEELGHKINFTQKKEEMFSFTTIDENNNKTTKTLSVEDSEFVIKRLTELARQAADNNIES